MDYAALRAALDDPQLAGLSDAEAAAALRAQTVTVHRDVPTADAREILLAAGVWPAIVMAAEPGSEAPTELRGVCILVRDTLTDARPSPTVDDLTKMAPGWPTCVLVALVRELHAGAGTKPPAWLVDPPA